MSEEKAKAWPVPYPANQVWLVVFDDRDSRPVVFLNEARAVINAESERGLVVGPLPVRNDFRLKS